MTSPFTRYAHETPRQRFERNWRTCADDGQRAGFAAEVKGRTDNTDERQWLTTLLAEREKAKRKAERR